MKKTWIALIGLILVAFLLRIFRLDFVSLRGDEAFTVIFVQRTWDGLWKGIRTIEPNPPLLYLALRAWVAVAGQSEFVTRFFSAFFGVLCIPLLYRLARELFAHTRGRAIALAAAALITINPYQIWHSQDIRNYTMWPALSLLGLIFLLQWLRVEREHRRRTLIVLYLTLYVLATTASLYTHYYDTFILVAENIFVFGLLALERKWTPLVQWIAAQAVLAAVYVPWVLFGTNRVTTYGEASAEQSVPLLDQFSRTLATFVLGDTVPDTAKTMLWLPLALVLVAVFIYLVRRERRAAMFLLLTMAVPALALFVISIGRPLFLERYLNGIAPEYYLVFAVGLVAVGQLAFTLQSRLSWFRQLPAAVYFLFFVCTGAYALANYYFDPAYAKAPDWRALGQVISAQVQPGDIIVQNFNEMAAIYYRNSAVPVMTLPKDYWARPEDTQTLAQLNRDYDRIWFIPAAPDFWDSDHYVEKYLSRYDDRQFERHISSFRLQLYVTPRGWASSIIPLNARVGNATLVGYRLQGLAKGTSTTAGPANLHVVLYWRAESKINQDLTVFVHLAAADEHVVAQQDHVPVDGTWPTTAWEPGELIVDAYDLNANLTPGSYSLIAGMYVPETLTRVPVSDAAGISQPGNRLVLSPITVVP